MHCLLPHYVIVVIALVYAEELKPAKSADKQNSQIQSRKQKDYRREQIVKKDY